MARVGVDSLRCAACAHGFRAVAARSLGPSARPAIRAGTLHHVRCPACGLAMLHERPRLYLDLDRQQVVGVQPPDQLQHFAQHEAELRAAFAQVATAAPADFARARVRLVFGVDALREKLVLWDAGLDDALVELLKRDLGLKGVGSALRVTEVTPDALRLQGPAGPLRVARARYTRFEAARPWLTAAWPHLFQGPWVDAGRPFGA